MNALQAIPERQPALDALFARIFPPSTTGGGTDGRKGTEISENMPRNLLKNETIIRRASTAQNGEKFNALWAGDHSAYGSRSEADAALCSILAFWIGPDAERIDRLFRQSGLMREKWERDDYREQTIALALQRTDYYVAGSTTLPAAEATASDSSKTPQKTQATQLVELAHAARIELFHTPHDEAYATVPVSRHRETLRLNKTPMRRWLSRLYYTAKRATPSNQALLDAIGTLEGEALYDGATYQVHVRVAEHDGAIWLDLGDDQWRVVRIDPSGWAVCDDVPLRFRRPPTMAPLPEPTAGGNLEALRPYLNGATDQDTWVMLVAWLLAALRPRGPYPLLALHGEQGSAKSTTARILRALVDPSQPSTRAEPHDERDLAVAAGNAWCLSFDNLSRIPGWLSDALCRLSTGGGFATRELYSDRDETFFDYQRPTIVTGIEDLATRSDLLDRSIVRWLPAIDPTQRQTEDEFLDAFERDRPAILGALLTCVSGALRELPAVQIAELPRLADFAKWITAAEPSLGWEQGTFQRVYRQNRDAVNDLALDSAPVLAPLRTLAEKYTSDNTWEGTMTGLLKELAETVDETISKARDWPKSGRALSNTLRRFAPNLRSVGIHLLFDQRKAGGDRQRLVRIWKKL